MVNNPQNPFQCMYVLRKYVDMTDDLIVTGGHGILKERLTKKEILMDYRWFYSNKKYSVIDKMYLQRAAFNPDFVKIDTTEEFEYYHFVLEGKNHLKRYGVWANGVLSESTFERDIFRLK